MAFDIISSARDVIGMSATQQELGQWFDAAIAAENGGEPERALGLYERILSHACAVPQVLLRKGIVLAELGRPDDALAAFAETLRQAPALAEAHFCRSTVLHALGRREEALHACDTALGHDPSHERAAYNRCVLLRELERFEAADAGLLAGIDRWPANPMFRIGLAETFLRDGEFAKGWPLYDGRLALFEVRANGVSQWRGENLKGKRLWIQAEQGLGDTIQFCRFALAARDAGAHVIFHVQPRLRRLLGDNLMGIEVGSLGDAPPRSDFHSPLLSLPRWFGTTLESLPAFRAYIRPDPARVAHWRSRLAGSRLRIGIAWQGDGSFQGKPKAVDIGRSFPVACLAGLADLPGVQLMALQKNQGLEQLQSLPPGMRVHSPQGDFDDGPDGFLDTAAIMACCDLVITSDTAIAHLAGATGTPAWLALQKNAEWRWLRERADSPWYASLRLFRQGRNGDWKSVFGAMERILAAKVRA